ncbi:MAG: hypothetical protein RKP20_06020 [Candidatus Competibacter sp.]|nr:hypothetical protein [Candidatus Competibacter sp.]
MASLATVGLAAWASFEPALARSAYLRLALFHGPVELAVVLLWLLEGRAAIADGTAA